MQNKKKSLPLHPQLRNKPSAAIFEIVPKGLENCQNEEIFKKNEKSSSKIWRFQKFALPLHHFRQRNRDEGFENGSLNYWLYLREKM